MKNPREFSSPDRGDVRRKEKHKNLNNLKMKVAVNCNKENNLCYCCRAAEEERESLHQQMVCPPLNHPSFLVRLNCNKFHSSLN